MNLAEARARAETEGTEGVTRARTTVRNAVLAATTILVILVGTWMIAGAVNSNNTETAGGTPSTTTLYTSGEAVAAATSSCPGTPPDPDKPRQIRPGETVVVNAGKDCAYSFSVIRGEVVFDSPAPAIPEEATCKGPEPCELYEMRCPFGKGPKDGSWMCRPV